MSNNDTAFDIYSDTYKEVFGFRPRGRLALAFLAANQERRAALLGRLAEQASEDEALAEAVEAAFVTKLEGLGLRSPEHFLELAH